MSKSFHTPVLLQEVIDGLKVRKGKRYIDATVGLGGHSLEIVKRGGRVLGIDVDQEAIWKIKNGGNLRLVRGNFREIDTIARSNNFTKVSGILFDLGLSSYQVDNPTRGFSFLQNGPLDMRMDKDLAVLAKDLINGLSKNELYELFRKFGEEPRARSISETILRSRRVKPIETTQELVEIIERAYKRSFSNSAKQRAGLSKRVFQALRIAVNDELNNLRDALPKSVSLLQTGGRLLVISFHSLEDRIVKEYFFEFEKRGEGVVITKKPIVPSVEEIRRNKRSRSAKLRIFEKRP